MITHRQLVLHGDVTSEHVVQLFDAAESVGTGVASFLAAGLARSASLLVVARPRHVEAVSDAFASAGHDPRALIDNGTLTVLDAKATLRHVMRGGAPDAALFEASVGDLARRLIAGSAGPFYAYGEMVDLLAEEERYAAVDELERLWNDIGESESFSLLCGYSSSHFAAAKGDERLKAVCRHHTGVHRNNDDLLGNWLLNTAAAGSAA